MDKNEYAAYAKKAAAKSPVLKNCLLAFVTGGAICVLAQVLKNVYSGFLSDKDSASLTSVTLIFIAVLLTGIGVFDRIASFAGAGTLVPITGFANAVASPAIDFRAEGVITGTAVKMFTVAGPVIVFGTAASVVYGVILCLRA